MNYPEPGFMRSPEPTPRARASVGRWGAVVGLFILWLGTAIRRGGPVGDLAFTYAFYALLLAWAWAIWPSDVGAREGIGAAPRDRRMWAWVGLAVPLIAFELTFLVGAVYLLSCLAPHFVSAHWAFFIDADRSPVAAPPPYQTLSIAETVVVAPVAEEVFFRGALLQRWTPRWGARRALVASSLLFGLPHFPDVVGAVVFGACMALLARRAGTLLLPIGVHVCHNGLLVVIIALSALSPHAAKWRTLAEFRADAPALALACVPATAAIVMAMRYLGRPAPDRRVHTG